MRKFNTELRKARLACFVAQLACGLGYWVAVLCGLVVLATLADWGFVLESNAREALLQGLLVLAALLLVPVLLRAVWVARRLPAELDALNEDPRRTVSCAMHLPRGDEAPLAAWLAEQARTQAAEAVCRARRHSPALRRWFFALLIPALVAAACIGLYSVAPVAFCTLAVRLLQPQEDVPPYSPYRFSLYPEQPQVHFGEDLPVSCRIEGGTPPEEVNLLLRAEGMPVQVLPTFLTQDGLRVRVLEKVTSPCEVAFATADGRARSRFVPVQVNYSPRILSGRATISPLPYTGEPEKEVTLGGSEVPVPDGGTVNFRLSCSTEIVKGYGLFLPAGADEPVRISGKVSGREMELSLPVRTPGTLTMQVVDAAGREADAPVQTRLAVLPDTPPAVVISKPEDGAYLVAGHPLDVEVEAEDDYGLTRFSLYKALAPYRQHGNSELDGKPRKQNFTRRYDTAAMGLRPGDKLELRAEVGDDNPFRFNIVSSPTTVVNVISESEYAEILRLELSYEEFLSRYEALEEAIAAATRALESGDAAAARQAMEDALKLARTFAKDFPAFDMDGSLSELSSRIAQTLEQNLQELSASGAEAMPQLLQRLKGLSSEMAEQAEQAREVALLARAAEAQQKFMQLVQRQEQMVVLFRRFMDEFGAASTSEPGRLEGLGAEQDALMQEYVAWEESLSDLLAELGQHESLKPMYQQIFAMRHACEQEGVEGLMDQAVAEATAHHPADAHSYAAKALAGMQKLLKNECSQNSCNNASSQCRNGMCDAARNTLQQLLDAMSGRRQGKSPGHGMGSGNGSAPSPNARGGRLMGPSRSRMARNTGRGRASAPGSSQPQSPVKSSRMQPRSIGTPAPGTVAYPDAVPEFVPAGYRDAVRSYFSY